MLSILLAKKKNVYTSTDVIINQYGKNTPLGHTERAIYKQIIFCSDVIIHKLKQTPLSFSSREVSKNPHFRN